MGTESFLEEEVFPEKGSPPGVSVALRAGAGGGQAGRWGLPCPGPCFLRLPQADGLVASSSMSICEACWREGPFGATSTPVLSVAGALCFPWSTCRPQPGLVPPSCR